MGSDAHVVDESEKVSQDVALGYASVSFCSGRSDIRRTLTITNTPKLSHHIAKLLTSQLRRTLDNHTRDQAQYSQTTSVELGIFLFCAARMVRVGDKSQQPMLIGTIPSVSIYLRFNEATPTPSTKTSLRTAWSLLTGGRTRVARSLIATLLERYVASCYCPPPEDVRPREAEASPVLAGG